MEKKYCKIGSYEKTDKGFVFSECYSGEGMIFKDEENFDKDWSLPCYVPEGEFDDDEKMDKEYYTHEGLLSLCFNNHRLCNAVFSELDWVYPETLLNEMDMFSDFRWYFDFVKVGARVKWNDPSGKSTGIYEVYTIPDVKDEMWWSDSIVLIGNGVSEAEVNLCELEAVEFNENELFDMFCELYHDVRVEFKDNEDEFHSIAHGMFMDNVIRLERDYPFLKQGEEDNDSEMWYDTIHDRVVSYYMERMNK